ncbi:MAG: hypothetical protein M3552_12840 [Planctomycetota bacterium]|nr:hypothetical protein [Planctomycetaceae bacterium]MDQ3331520.1 hypothetical protein [Planctomycetota bacterium]
MPSFERSTKIVAAVLSAMAPLAVNGAEVSPRRPNVVFIMADDMDDLLRWRTEKASVVLIFDVAVER